MKKLLLLPLSLGFLSLISFKDQLEKSLPDYFVASSKPDSTLQKNESLFAFSFYDENGNPITKEIKLSYNGVNKTVQCDKKGKATLKIKPGKYQFQFFYSTDYYEIATDSIQIKPAFRSEIQVHFKSSTSPIMEDKPVIYVYPTQSQAISINLELKGKLGFTYPAYENGWNFIADPDGTIHMNDKKYNYLFWEGNTEIDNSKINWEEGFVVGKDSLVPFFESKLSAMGLNSKEIEDYITYWCPRMNVNEKNYVHFLFNEEYDEYAKMNVTPKPDRMFSVFMIWSKADSNAGIIQQAIPSFHREGFTVVEWGGGEMEHLPIRSFEENED